MYKFIDLFSWAWWLSHWFIKAWYKQVFSVEIMPDYADTYKKNFPFHELIQKDISIISEKEILSKVDWQEIDVIIWWPPCQWFSMAWNIGRNFVDDPRNHLFKEFLRVVKIVKPKMFLMENVARLFTHNQWQTKQEIINSFESIWYKVSVGVIDSSCFWVPQVRRRVFFIWSLEEKVDIPIWNNSKLSLLEAIDHFPRLKSWEKSKIKNHNAMNHSKQMLTKMWFITDGWNREEIPEKIRPKSWDARKYIKYNSRKPSITITGDMRKVFHYNQNRALTVRELASIQTFPEDFVFMGASISQQQQVWNAVPPQLSYEIAKYLKKYM